jgi:ABC-type phosphate/phosphonate transport system substrate-binding protein
MKNIKYFLITVFIFTSLFSRSWQKDKDARLSSLWVGVIQDEYSEKLTECYTPLLRYLSREFMYINYLEMHLHEDYSFS